MIPVTTTAEKHSSLTLIALLALVCCSCFGALLSCSKTDEGAPLASAVEASEPETSEVEEAPPVDAALLERLKTERWKGDLGGLVKRRYIRALVLYNKTTFFYDGPHPKGVTYESLREFEKFLNTKLKTGREPVYVVVIPVPRSEAAAMMADGRGDIAASNIPIMPDLEKIVDFSDPVRSDAKEIIVTGPSAPPLASIDDLSGQEIYVRRTSRYWPNLEKLNERFSQQGKSPAILKAADENLQDEDILDMVNAGLVGMTALDDLVGEFWAPVYESIQVHKDIQISDPDRIAWALQKDTPELKALVNEFVASHKIGTSFGNAMLTKYLKNTKWVKNNATTDEIAKFKSNVEFFKKYGGQYGFDWLMIGAQAYQESTIDQSVISPAGAVGVMQIKPSTAADPSVGITGVEGSAEKNIQAGVKYLKYLADRYFSDPSLTKTNKALFAFAAYNAGPARVADLRKKAKAEGLDPDVWFGNVEQIASREIGRETVTYVSNIYKYYVAYKLVADGSSSKSKPF